MFLRRIIPATMAAAIAVLLTQSYALAQFNSRPGLAPAVPAAAATFNPFAHSFGLGSIVVVPSGFGYVQSFMNADYNPPPATASYDSTDYSLHNTTQPPLPPDWNYQPYGVPRDIHPQIREYRW